MIVSLLPRGIGAAALAAGLMLAGCSSDSDVPQTIASAPGGGTQINTDTGSGGTFPDINTVPNERPTSTIQDLTQAPEGLSGAQSGTQYGEALVGGPSSSVAPPEPPPPPEPQEELAPIPEPGLQTQTSGASSAPNAPPEVAEPQPMEPVVAQTPPAPGAPQGQTIQGTMGQPSAAQEVQPAPMAAEPQQPEPMAAEPQQPAPTVSTPQPEAEPEGRLASAPDGAPTSPLAAAQQAQLPARAYGHNYRASAPEAYGIAVPQPVPSPYQAYNPAQALHPANYGGVAAAPVVAPGAAGYGQPYYAGQPVGLIYFRNGSSDLSSDDRRVLKEMADMQRAYGGVVNVIGHASMGAGTVDYADDQANQRVSEARANAVGRQLLSYGVPQNAIRILAVGASQPLYSEAMPTGEAANRRAEVYLSAY